MTTKPLSIHLKPKTKRSGGPGDEVVYKVLLANNDSRRSKPGIWAIGAGFMPSDKGMPVPPQLSVIVPDPVVTIAAQATLRYEVIVFVGAGAPPGVEVDLVFWAQRVGETTSIFDRRYFTTDGGTTRPR